MTRRVLLFRAGYPISFVFQFPEQGFAGLSGALSELGVAHINGVWWWVGRRMSDAMASQSSDDPYISEYPSNCKIGPDIQALIRYYYKQVDTKGKHVEYSECWAEDGVLIIPTGKEFRGRDAIRAVHEGMWPGVEKRVHRLKKIYPFGDNADEVVVVGTVEYWTEDGSYIKKDMAARAKYQRNPKSSVVEMSTLQVWLTA